MSVRNAERAATTEPARATGCRGQPLLSPCSLSSARICGPFDVRRVTFERDRTGWSVGVSLIFKRDDDRRLSEPRGRQIDRNRGESVIADQEIRGPNRRATPGNPPDSID